MAVMQGFIAGMITVAPSGPGFVVWEAALWGILGGLAYFGGKFLADHRYLNDKFNVIGTILLPGLVGNISPGFLHY